MQFEQSEWLGRWDNFEGYIDSNDPDMKKTWETVETAIRDNPAMTTMFSGGVKAFWQSACRTVTAKNPIRLGGWIVTEATQGMMIEWLAEDGQSLGKQVYRVRQIVQKGLEGKENFLFEAADACADWPFRYLLAMPPMPTRAARENGGLLSHLHFQYGGNMTDILADGKLRDPRWYATMCAEGTTLERCNIVRVLHRLPPLGEDKI